LSIFLIQSQYFIRILRKKIFLSLLKKKIKRDQSSSQNGMTLKATLNR